MTIYEFNLLDGIRQAEVVENRGVLIADRLHKQLKILLFQVDNFYIEVYYHNTYNVVQGFRSFESTDALDPYLEHISLPDLI